MLRDLDKKSRRTHNYKRDLILVIVAVVAIAFYFQSENNFFFSVDQAKKNSVRSHEKIVYEGPATPAALKLTSKDLAQVDRFAAKNAKHFKQIRIFIERQDSYGGLKPSTQLRFYTITRFNDDAEIKSVYTPTTLKRLPARIVQRLKGDISKYFSVKKKMQGKDIQGFTNTM